MSSGIARSWIAAAAVITLFVDPGSYASVTARLRNVELGASSNAFGSNHG